MKKTLFAMLAMAAALCAQARTIELLTNGAGTTLDGWTNTGSDGRSRFVIFTDNSNISWFGSERAQSYTEEVDAQLSQTVTLPEVAVQSNRIVKASVDVVADSGSGTCNVKVYELDASDHTLETHVILDKAGETIASSMTVSASFRLNSSTRKLKYELNGRDSIKWAGCYGPKFRNCSLVMPETLGDKQVMTIDSDVTLMGVTGISPIVVEDNAQAIINIKNGATLTVNGADASGTTGAAPAIHVPEGSTLYIVGEGTLIATGGAAANGGWGRDGSSGGVDIENTRGSGGAGGEGGAGGGGGAPAIGGIGGAGGAGGSGGDYTEWRTCDKDSYIGNGNDGGNGASGSNGGDMGKVVILGNVTVQATAGASATSDAGGGLSGAGANDSGSGWSNDFTAGGGGGGGGGARGQHSQYGIGGGGAGGAGGGGGGAGGTFCNSRYTAYVYAWGAGGKGGTSYAGTTGASGGVGGDREAYDENYGTAYGGSGGYGGSQNTTHGSEGTFQALNCVTLTVSPSRTAAQPIAQSSGDAVADSVTVTFMSDGVSVGTAPASLMFAPPAAPAASKANSEFQGYYTADGTQIYDANLNPVYPVWQTVEDTTLYARWAQSYTLNFVSEGGTVGMGEYTEGGTVNAPIPQRAGDYVFQGYYTENGVQVFNASGALVEGSLSGLPSNVSLYAHWTPPEGSIAKLVYRGQLTRLGTDDPAASEDKYTKTMHFRVYDDESAETPIWKVDNQTVTINKDGSFMATFGDETLAELIATGSVTHVGVAIGSSGIELKPRRALRPVAVVNRALVAEAAGKDPRIGNLISENALAANNVTISQLEVTGTVTAPGAGPVDVSPVVVGERETLTLLRGDGVNVFSKNRIDLGETANVLRGQKIGSRAAPSDGIALITSRKEGARGLRIPGVIQYCREGDWVRAPASEPDGVKVTFFPFVGSAR